MGMSVRVHCDGWTEQHRPVIELAWWVFPSDLGKRTRKRYLYAPGRAQSAVHSSWHSSLVPAERETLL